MFQRIVVILLLFIFFAAPSCKDDINLGSGNNDSDDGNDDDPDSPDNPVDNDGDGLSNEVEETFSLLPRVADSDQDGFGDGLEFVGSGGDPLNPSATPVSQSRARVLSIADAVQNDLDRDLDGLGDSFENANSMDPLDADIDNDGYEDGLELVANSNPFDNADRPMRDAPPASDGSILTGSPPSDLDQDGISDSLEGLNGTTNTDRDSDGDGFSDGIEFLTGADATDFLSVPNFSVPLPPDTSS